MRGDERGATRDIPRLPAEAVRLPGGPVSRPFQDDLGAARRHHREQAVVVDRSERAGRREQRACGPRKVGPAVEHPAELQRRQQKEQRSNGRECEPRRPPRLRRRRDALREPPRKETGEERVIEGVRQSARRSAG